jgi:hypothetical protein
MCDAGRKANTQTLRDGNGNGLELGSGRYTDLVSIPRVGVEFKYMRAVTNTQCETRSKTVGKRNTTQSSIRHNTNTARHTRVCRRPHTTAHYTRVVLTAVRTKDTTMPSYGGQHLCTWLRQPNPKSKVILPPFYTTSSSRTD